MDDLETQEFFVSRDVVFGEHIFPFDRIENFKENLLIKKEI